MRLKKITVINDGLNDLFHVVNFSGAVRYN